MGTLDFFNVLLEGNNVKVSTKAGEKSSEAFAEAENFFMALSRALSEIETKAKSLNMIFACILTCITWSL